MAVKRCTECRLWFEPEVKARNHQVVCGPTCRLRRRRKLARGRRQKDLEAYQKDEKLRQQECRARRRKQREVGGDGGARGSAEPAHTSQVMTGCHAPPSVRKRRKSRLKSPEIVDKPPEVSRAGLAEDLERILLELLTLKNRIVAFDGRRSAALEGVTGHLAGVDAGSD